MGEAGRWIWVGGEGGAVRPEEARIAATDHAYLYGSGLYETIRTYHARPFALEQHMARLEHGVRRMGFGPVPFGEVARALGELAALRAPEDSYLRVTLSCGLQFPGWSIPVEGPPRWVAYAGPLSPHVSAYYERGVRCTLSTRPRWNPCGFVPAVKFGGNPELQLAKKEADAKGAFEALLLNPDGALAEGSSSNVFLVKGRRIVTPDLASGILDGVTRAILLHLSEREGIGVEERPVRPEELWEAEELFVASTLKEVVPVVEVDGRPIGTGTPGMVTDRLLGLYQEHALETTRG